MFTVQRQLPKPMLLTGVITLLSDTVDAAKRLISQK